MLNFLGDYGEIISRTLTIRRKFQERIIQKHLNSAHKTASLSTISSFKAKLNNFSLKLTLVDTEVLETVLNLKS